MSILSNSITTFRNCEPKYFLDVTQDLFFKVTSIFMRLKETFSIKFKFSQISSKFILQSFRWHYIICKKNWDKNSIFWKILPSLAQRLKIINFFIWISPNFDIWYSKNIPFKINHWEKSTKTLFYKTLRTLGVYKMS